MPGNVVTMLKQVRGRERGGERERERECVLCVCQCGYCIHTL